MYYINSIKVLLIPCGSCIQFKTIECVIVQYILLNTGRINLMYIPMQISTRLL